MHRFKGTFLLVKSNLRRDGLRLAIWLGGLTILSLALMSAYATMMDEEALKEIIIMRASNPAIRMLDSPSPGLSLGGFYTARSSVLMTILIIAMTIQTMNKHTRENEETGVSDLVSSTMVGRYAPLTAAIIVTLLANIFMIFATTFVLYAYDLDLLYSFYTGVSFSLMGIFMIGVMAIAVQISQTTSGASKIGWLTTLFFFTISALGNLLGDFNPETFKVASHNITFLSPFGWYQQMAVFHENNMYLIVPFLVSFVILSCIGYKLINKRDVGHGLIPDKSGRKDAHKNLLSPLGLWRNLGRKTFILWLIIIGAFGLLFGYVSDEFEEGLAEIEGLEYIFGDISSTDYFLAMIISIVVICLLFFYINSLLRLRREEVDGTIENILASGVTRSKLMAMKILDATFDLFVLIILLVVTIYIGAIGQAEVSFLTMLEAGVSNAFAIMTVGALVVFAIGLIPKLASAFAYLMMLIAIGLGPVFGPMFNIDEWFYNLSPFSHVRTPLEDFVILPYLIMSVIIIIAVTIGFNYYKKRNLELN